MLRLPCFDVIGRCVVPWIGRHLLVDIDDDERPDSEGRGQVADGCAVLVPVRRRVQLRAVLIRRQIVGARDEAVLDVGEFLPFLDFAGNGRTRDGRKELRMSKARPDRDGRTEGMRQVDVLRLLQGVIVDLP